MLGLGLGLGLDSSMAGHSTVTLRGVTTTAIVTFKGIRCATATGCRITATRVFI